MLADNSHNICEMFLSSLLDASSSDSTAHTLPAPWLSLQLAAHTLLFAVVNVVLSTLAAIPLMLWGLGMASAGWGVMDAALFGAMLGSTDAVAVAAILKAGGSEPPAGFSPPWVQIS